MEKDKKYKDALGRAQEELKHTTPEIALVLNRIFPGILPATKGEAIRRALIDIVNQISNKIVGTWTCNSYTREEILSWLESQQPAEWSEEDLQHKSWILECLADGERKMPEYAEDFRAAYNWLKSLRPQPHWKPSEEQINALEAFVGMIHPDCAYDAVNELLNQLKGL